LVGEKNQEFAPAPVVTYSTDAPDERLPERAGYRWQGQASDPKRVIIPSIDVNALIQNVGIDQNSQIAVPNNVHIAGWFVESVLPAEKGLSIIDGHVNGVNIDEGVFKRLGELQKGQEVIIAFGDDSEKKFRVFDVVETGAEASASILFSQIPSIERQLNLITCSGNYDTAARSYINRTIAILEAV
jgi:sortase (surface protein transpeptidase)